jgi:hypothetical protein
MAANMTAALTYSDLEMSRVDVQLEKDCELLVVLPIQRAQILISLIESSRGLTQRPSVPARVRLLFRGLWATFSAMLFHGKLMNLSRVLVYASGSATWKPASSGDIEFKFSR